VIPIEQIDIPKLAFLEHEVFMEAHKLGALNIANGNILVAKGLDREALPPPPYLQTRILSCLYLLLVFPRELWNGTEAGRLVLKHLEDDARLKSLCKSNLNDFLRHIRNSISHARVSVTPEGITTFVDMSFKGEETFCAVLSLEQVQLLLLVVGSAFAELRERPNRTENLNQLRVKP
jgi:hypothetical protein